MPNNLKNKSVKKIALLGATGNIGKALGNELSGKAFIGKFKVFQYARSLGNLQAFGEAGYDVIINCIGIGSPAVLKRDPAVIFGVTEQFDSLVMGYLEKNPRALYINMSSGAVYGKNVAEPAAKDTVSVIAINAISPSDYYAIAKINSEAKHRARPDLRIVDLRVFSFFSRFMDASGGFMMSEIADCLRTKKTFLTSADDIVRDYVIAEDLLSLIQAVIDESDRLAGNGDVMNDFYDVSSKKHVSKFALLKALRKEFDFSYEQLPANPASGSGNANTKVSKGIQSPTGAKMGYYSRYKKAAALGYSPMNTSLEGVIKEMKMLLKI